MRVTRKPEVAWHHYLMTTPCRRRASPFPFCYGRTALTFGIRALGLPPGAEVVCPDYVCHSLVAPLQRAQLSVRFHPVNDDLTPDWEALDALPQEAAAALVLVHYFGVPQDVMRYRAYCNRRGWRLIEDNAHGYGAVVDSRELGTFGDLGIASPYKSFAIRNGGLLYLPPGTHFELPELPCQPVGLPMRLARTAVRRVLDTHTALRARVLACPPYASQAAFRNQVVDDWAMDAWSYDHLSQEDLASLRSRRQALYQIWRVWTSGQGLKPVFPAIPAGSMPLVYAASTGSARASERWFRWGHRHAIDVHSWPTLPEAIVRENGTAMRRWERLVCFPLHQGLDPDRLEATLRRLPATVA